MVLIIVLVFGAGAVVLVLALALRRKSKGCGTDSGTALVSKTPSYDIMWQEIRAKRVWTPLQTLPGTDGVEPFMREGQPSFSLFVRPSNEWVRECERVIEAASEAMLAPDAASLTDEITIVTTLLDLKRGSEAGDGFQRSMQEYYDRFNRILLCNFKMVIFIPVEMKAHLSFQDNARVTIVHFSDTDLKNYFPYYERVQAIRTSPTWKQQSHEIGWLEKSPQASLAGYCPLIMSKMFLVRDAAKMNPYKTKYFLFLDSGHLCATTQTPEQMQVFTSNMNRAFLLTHWPYSCGGKDMAREVHGMTCAAMQAYAGSSEPTLRIVRGGVFGGKIQHIDVVAKVYEITLAQTLSDGYMGTEENILAIILARFPRLFSAFDNNQFGKHDDSCAIFDQQTRVAENKEA